MKLTENTENFLSEVLSSGKIKHAAKIAVFTGLLICILLMLPPMQKLIASFAGTISPHVLSLPFAALFLLTFACCCLYSEKISAFMENPVKSGVIFKITVVVLVVLTFFIGIFSYRYGWQWLDSDYSAEMVLGKLLAQENTFVSANWFYSNEIRIIYQTLFTMPLFKIFGRYENWALIRALNIVLNNFVLIASYVFMVKQMKVPVKWITITCLFLLMPLSYSYWNVITFGGYYIFFAAQVFCCLGLFVRLVSNTGTVKTFLTNIILFALLSFMLGVQGIRALFTFYVPLFISCVYIWAKIPQKQKTFLFFGLSGFISCCIGFAVNCLLQFKYHFFSFADVKLEDLFNNLFPKLGQSLASLVYFFGYSAGSPQFSARGIFSIAAIIVVFAMFWCIYNHVSRNQVSNKELRDEHQFMVLFFAVSVICNIIVFIIANKNVTRRYFEPFMILYIPLVAILFEYAEGKMRYLKRTAVIFGVMLFIVGQGCLNFQSLAERDTNTIRKGYLQYLSENRLEYGFATFWNAKVTTELSNGRIEVAGLEFARTGTGKNALRVHDYLNPVYFMDPFYSPANSQANSQNGSPVGSVAGESFLLLTHSEWDSIRNRTRNANRSVKPDYQDSHFIVVKYPSPAAIHREFLSEPDR